MSDSNRGRPNSRVNRGQANPQPNFNHQVPKVTDRFDGSTRPIANERPGPAGGPVNPKSK
jgi:hypothetical protein